MAPTKGKGGRRKKKVHSRKRIPQEVRDMLFDMYKSGATAAVMIDRSGLSKSCVDRYRGKFKQELKAEGKGKIAPKALKKVTIGGRGDLADRIKAFKFTVKNVLKLKDDKLVEVVDLFFPDGEYA